MDVRCDVALEGAAREFVEVSSRGPLLSEVPVGEARLWLEEIQGSAGVPRPDVDEEWVDVSDGGGGVVRVRIVRPVGVGRVLPVVLYLHGGGWVSGSARTHDRLVRELAVRADVAVVFPEYERAPEAPYPVALEQCYAVARWVVAHGAGRGLDGAALAVAGDSAGGNLAAVVCLMAKARSGPPIRLQVLFYPVTDTGFDTASYREFGTGLPLTEDAMRGFVDRYLPDPARRGDLYAAPLRAEPRHLHRLPPALVVTAEADVLRDEGEAYAGRLRAAGVEADAVRVPATIHDFLMLDALRGTDAVRTALDLATGTLREYLHG
ncbi:alpha/beta hydrolase [Actinomadura flavalba]|uniref:alpha/beta hydrolase n=1 Tax=Actinomadura flavalba TaxID=1120938 RepID=UPI0004777C98|nr:alpha/beta hydrolase [Actinomadura flavalba]